MPECGWCLAGAVVAVVLAGGFGWLVWWLLRIIAAGREEARRQRIER